MSGVPPAGSAFETDQSTDNHQALPTKATASAIELGTFEPGHDESDLITEDEPNG